jgi:hypothetical protein
VQNIQHNQRTDNRRRSSVQKAPAQATAAGSMTAAVAAAAAAVAEFGPASWPHPFPTTVPAGRESGCGVPVLAAWETWV